MLRIVFKINPHGTLIRHFFTGLFLTAASVSYGADLMDIYRQALDNDPIFKAAYNSYKSQAEALPQAWAALLPKVGSLAQIARNKTEVHSPSIDVQQMYGSNQWQISASQAVFNYQAWSQVQQAKAAVKAALATFNDAAQNLILRSSKAYFDLLFARDTLNFAEAKKLANKKQLDQAQQRFNVGLDAITSVYEAQAAYDQSVAQVISAQNALINQGENLSKLTNHTYEQISVLRNSKIPLIKPEPANRDDWVATGLKQNYNLFAARYNLQASRENIKAQTAGHLPTFAIQASTVTTHNDTGESAANSETGFVNNIFIPEKQVMSNLALTMNFPIFQGGLVVSQVRQAKYKFQASSEQLEKTYRDVVVNSRIAYNTIIDGISKVEADRRTVISQRKSLDSVQAQYEVGTRTMTDVVNAQRYLFEAQNQLAGDQYGLIAALLNLKYLSGTLNVTDLQEVNAWLSTTRVDGVDPLLSHRS